MSLVFIFDTKLINFEHPYILRTCLFLYLGFDVVAVKVIYW